MALSLIGWINGLSASGIVIFSCLFGLFCIYEGKKTNAKLLSYMGLGICCGGLVWLSNFLDFLTILSTGNNMDITTYRIFSIISYIWMAPMALIMMYIGAELMIPEKKWYIISIVLVLCIVVEIFIVLDPSSFNYIYPSKPGEDLIDDNIALNSPLGIIFIIFILSGIIFLGFGFLIKAIQSSGILKKKYLLFSIGYFIWSIFGILEGLFDLGIAIIFIRISMIISLWFLYLALREEPEKTKKVPTKKEVKVEGDLFRISKRPDQITEEEVSISKEKKICLVCKGKVLGNTYICTECEAFYCMKCSQAIANLENACWACNAPIDESKPSKSFKQVEEEIVDIEVSEKPQKKTKNQEK